MASTLVPNGRRRSSAVCTTPLVRFGLDLAVPSALSTASFRRSLISQSEIRATVVSGDTRVPTANSTLVTIACESADYRCDEGLLQLDLVRSGRPVPVAGGAASRNP